MSAVYDYGPCIQLFGDENEFDGVAGKIINMLDRLLPSTFEGLSVLFPANVGIGSSLF